MAKQRTTRIQDILGLINAFCPATLAEEWDNVGLQVGDPAAEVSTVAVALDPTEVTIEAAIAEGAQLLVCHHPLIFKPLRQVTPNDTTGALVTRAVGAGLAIICAHTNLDRARGGLNDWLGAKVGLKQMQPLESIDGQLFKLVVFVPQEQAGAVAEALFAGGAGQVGAYDHCSFRGDGVGTFRSGDESNPYIGESGRDESVAEVRLETIVAKEHLGRSVARMLKAHPYEEVAYDLLPLANSRNDVGLGRIGRLEEPESLGRYAQQVKELLAADHVRVVGDPEKQIAKVAVCGGSGASLVAAATRQGADLLLTGDVKYHDAQIAESLGLALIDAGHFATERIMIDGLATVLSSGLQQKNLDVKVLPLSLEQDPFRVI